MFCSPESQTEMRMGAGTNGTPRGSILCVRHSFYLQVFPGKRTHSAPSCPAPVPPPRGSPPPQVRAGLYDTCSPMRTRARPAACTAHPKAQAHSNHHGNNYIMCGLSRVFSSFFIISFSVHFYYNYLLNV